MDTKEEKFIRILPPVSYFSDFSDISSEAMWKFPIDWYLNLKLYEKDFVQLDNRDFATKIEGPNGEKLALIADSADFRRVFGYVKRKKTTIIEEGKATLHLRNHDSQNVEYEYDNFSIHIEMYGQNYKDVNFQKKVYQIKLRFDEFYERAVEIFSKAASWCAMPAMENAERNAKVAVLLHFHSFEDICETMGYYDKSNPEVCSKEMQTLEKTDFEKFKEKMLDEAIKNGNFEELLKKNMSVYQTLS